LRNRLVTELDFYVSDHGPGTIDGYLGETKVQFLDARTQTMLGEPTVVAGMPVAGLEDLMAMKIKVIGDRGELRDYFDLMEIERRTTLTFEESLGDYLYRYNPGETMSSLSHIVLALSSFADVADDPALPVGGRPGTPRRALRDREVLDPASGRRRPDPQHLCHGWPSGQAWARTRGSCRRDSCPKIRRSPEVRQVDASSEHKLR